LESEAKSGRVFGIKEKIMMPVPINLMEGLRKIEHDICHFNISTEETCPNGVSRIRF
jgi:hypothetical protein